MKTHENSVFDISFGLDAGEAPAPDFPDDCTEQISETRETVITRLIEDHDYFGLEVQTEEMIGWMVDTLLTVERECAQYVEGFDISTVPAENLSRLMQKWRAAFEADVTAADDAHRQELLEAYVGAFNDRPIVEVFTALAANEQLPEAVQLKAATYMQLVSTDIVKNKADREAITDKINQYSLVSAPQPMWFVASEILSDETLSEKTRKAIMKEFSLEPHALSGDALLQNIEKAKFVAIDRNIEANITDNGDVAVTLVGADNIDMPELIVSLDEAPEIVGLKMSLLKIGAVAEGDKFFGQSIEPRNLIENGFAQIDFDKFASLLGAVLGGTEQYKGEILNEEQIDYLIAFNSLCSTDDHAELLVLDFQALDDAAVIGRLKAIRQFIQRQPVTEAVDVDKLHDHLTLILPSASIDETGAEAENTDAIGHDDETELQAA